MRFHYERLSWTISSSLLMTLVSNFYSDMADPFSTTVVVASLVAGVTKILQSFINYHIKHNAFDLTSISIKAQCNCILVTLSQVQTALLSKQ